MAKQILSAIKVSILAVILSLGLSYVYAWTAPAGNPPAGNVSAPINTSGTAQTKAGGLTVGSISAPTHCIGADCRSAWPTPTGGVADNLGNQTGNGALSLYNNASLRLYENSGNNLYLSPSAIYLNNGLTSYVQLILGTPYTYGNGTWHPPGAGKVLTSDGANAYWATPAPTGVTSIAAGTGISVSSATGAVTVSASKPVLGDTESMILPIQPAGYTVMVIGTYGTCNNPPRSMYLDGVLVKTYNDVGGDQQGCDQNTIMAKVNNVSGGAHTWSINSGVPSLTNFLWTAYPN